MFWIERTVNGRKEWVGRDRKGRWQITCDPPSKTKFSTQQAAENAKEEIRLQALGDLKVVGDQK